MVDLGQLFSVASLALLGTLIVRRFALPTRVAPLVPVVLAVVIVWAFVGPSSAGQVLSVGGASGLLAAGLLYVFLGVSGRL